MSRKVALYGRVSTRGQELANPLEELTAACVRNDWQVVRVFTDYGISGAKGRAARNGLDDLLKAVVRREIDQVCVWSIDRLGRSLRDLINVLDELRQKDCELYVQKQAIDTNTSSGKMLFKMLGVFAEFEREIIRERIIAGQQRARAQGKQIGRKSVIDQTLRMQVLRLQSGGHSLRDIGGRLNASAATVLKALVAGSRHIMLLGLGQTEIILRLFHGRGA
jgi:DNA invertase Pin-like site-specific DNA recombinase